MGSGCRWSFLVFMTVAALCEPCAAQSVKSSGPGASADGYVALHGGTLVPAGRLEIDGRRMTCGQSPTVLDPGERDFGSAVPGFLVLNPDRFAGLPTPVKLWIYAHECAHQTVGPDEVKADCVAIQRGRKEGWLDANGLKQICEFMQPARADQSHFTGTQRCELMQQCFKATEKSERR
jgi:hypothetical protein